MTTLNSSRQRDSILKFLSTRKDHPTANTVFLNVRETYPKISLGTVYRNLNLLSDLGKIARIDIGDGYERFDYDTSPHFHVVCNCCHGVFDLNMDNIDDIMTTAQKNFSGRIDHYYTYFSGLCESCLTDTKADTIR